MRRRRTSSPAHTTPRRGGKPTPAASPRGYQPPPVPPTLIAEVVNVGAYRRGRILHRDLAALEWKLHLPKGLELDAGDFIEGVPNPHERNLLDVIAKVAPERAATAAAITNHALPREFPTPVLKEAAALKAYRFSPAEGRDDWRALPFITIDGEDARDFDDAVWAEPWESKAGDGHHVRVAIADVALYVAPGSDLDREAVQRGNSTYFPNQVLPMLPERLSNDLCSLNPATDKPVLAVEMWLNANGDLMHYHFCRAVIHSARRCTYTEVQAQLDGGHALPAALHAPVRHLHAAFQTLLAQRDARGALNLDLPELKLELDNKGRVTGAHPRPRLAAHMLIEELMIAANVAAATALSTGCPSTRPGAPRKHTAGPGVYRVHAHPSKEKQENLRSVLTPLGFTAPPPNSRPAAWAALAQRVQQHPATQTLQRALLQAQMQAQYTTENIGHFGLALNLYTHFTSPIRRYADLLVHRALLGLIEGKGAKADSLSATMLQSTCMALNVCERRSQQAEWEARDRMLAGWLTTQVGQTFKATVTNVAPFGCFVSLGETGAEALLPKWHLDDYIYVGGQNAFRRTRGGKGLLRAGSSLPVKLLQADFAAGRLTVGPASAPDAPPLRSAPLTRRPKRR